MIRHYHGHLSAVYCLSLHPTIDVLVTGGRDASARVSELGGLFVVLAPGLLSPAHLERSLVLSSSAPRACGVCDDWEVLMEACGPLNCSQNEEQGVYTCMCMTVCV